MHECGETVGGNGYYLDMRLTFFVALLFAAILSRAAAASLDGVELPERISADGAELHLNGFGMRTFSLLRIPVYVAGLYLERPSRDGEAILRSPETKLLDVHFVHEVDADRARTAWREGFQRNCRLPCRLDPDHVARFLDAIGPLQSGAHSTFTFAHGEVAIDLDGRRLGTVTDPQFASVILATFIGPEPAAERLKHALLGDPP